MGMVVNHNIPALISYNAVSRTNNALQKSIQKLSTGLRINSAADDAAGLAISEKMRAQIRGLDRAVANSQDGISMIQTAEGALNETHSILQRMRELSVQAANDTLTQQDRGYIQLEIDQLREEVTRIGNTTQFNKKKLLNGDAAVLWSSDKLNTKAIVNGGLRQIDQFGQKNAVEGNYKLDIKTEAGRGEIQKSDIFKIKHENVITNLKTNDKLITNDVRINNLPTGKGSEESVYSLRVATADIAAGVSATVLTSFGSTNISGSFLTGNAALSIGGSVSILAEVTDVNTATGRVSYLIKAEVLSAGGTNYSYEQKVTLGTAEVGAKLFSASAAFGENLIFSISGGAVVNAGNYKVGDKVVVNYIDTAAAAGGVVALEYTAAGKITANFALADPTGKTVTFKNFYIDSETGKATLGSVTTTFKANLGANAANSSTTIATFSPTKVGSVAKSDIKLRDLDKFWDAQGRFMLNDPQTITITQGDGKTTKVTLYGYDTLGDVAEKLNRAIADDLGQAQYVNNGGTAGDPAHFVSFVDNAVGNIESVKGTFVIRTAIPGTAGKISLAGDEDLIKAFSLNQLQEAKDSSYTVKVSNAHTNETLTEATVTGNKLVGVVNPNIDVEFDAMAGLKATWDDATKTYSYSAADYSTILHLADNTTVFQIGANEGEDMGVNLGDMRAQALGLNSVLVTDRVSAARSITIIDNAIDKVSTQRAKLGAYQNRLEHTISNLTVAGENLTAAESRIRDTDMAKEMMNFTKLNIMLQAGNSMLAQANQLPQNVLSLIR